MSDSKILGHSLTSKERTKDVILTENVSFASLILPPEILKGLTASGFEKPSPIQVKALPVGRCGFDLLVKSKAGTGKTLVFGVIALESVRLEKCCPQVLILAPTREIAVQIQEVIKSIGKYYEGLSVECFIGGLPVATDKTNCKSCHIAVGTPGRVKQLILDGCLSVDSIKIFALDEADKLTEDSFQNDINEIYNSLPDNKQIIMCSATYPDEMQTLLGQYMRSPVLVSVEIDTPLLLGLRQYVRLLKCSPNVVQQTKVKNDELLKIISAVPFVQCLIFSNYQNRAESISNFLNRSGWNSIFMSAAQSQTDRLFSLSNLKDFKTKILVTTDLSARGIDAPNVDLVVNYDTPFNATTYLHRMGRAGRYGSTGNCINLAFVDQEAKLLQNILGFIGGQNLSIPILDDSFNLDIDIIVKENYLSGIVADSVTDFSFYSNVLGEIRSSVAEHSGKNGIRKSKGKKLKQAKATKEEEIVNSVVEDHLNGDASSILAQLASGSFDLSSTVSELGPKTVTLISPDRVSAPKDVATKKESVGSCVKREQSPDPSLLLLQLADKGEILDNATPDSKERSLKADTFSNNKALFSVAKMLSNAEVSNEDCSELSAYFSNLKSQEDSGMAVDTPRSPEKLDMTDGKAAEEDRQRRYPEVLENIFTIAYKSQVTEGAEKWQNLIPEGERGKLKDDYVAVDTGEDDEASGMSMTEENDDEQYFDEDYDFEVEKQIEVNYEDKMDDYSFMEWVPVEPKKQSTQKKLSKLGKIQDVALTSSIVAKKKKTEEAECYAPNATTSVDRVSYLAQYDRYFQHCDNNLWQNGLTFDSVQRFDEWFFNDWERQLTTVRNFVQNKIYLEEMSHYY